MENIEDLRTALDLLDFDPVGFDHYSTVFKKEEEFS